MNRFLLPDGERKKLGIRWHPYHLRWPPPMASVPVRAVPPETPMASGSPEAKWPTGSVPVRVVPPGLEQPMASVPVRVVPPAQPTEQEPEPEPGDPAESADEPAVVTERRPNWVMPHGPYPDAELVCYYSNEPDELAGLPLQQHHGNDDTRELG